LILDGAGFRRALFEVLKNLDVVQTADAYFVELAFELVASLFQFFDFISVAFVFEPSPLLER
jgi:hypothetical protein